ncbi:hypothetical protein BSKO_05844 [Bryopsis sp. KO-2023]|nr:hypothetical protein BSKO_05844 [Bryopsis sp. KO-2023]
MSSVGLKVHTHQFTRERGSLFVCSRFGETSTRAQRPVGRRGTRGFPSVVRRPGLSSGERPKYDWELRCSTVPEAVRPVEESDGGDGGGGGGSTGGNGGGGDNGGDGAGSGGMSPGVAALLAQAGRSLESFPVDFAKAITDGKVTEKILQRYLNFEKNFIAGILFGFAGFRERMLADPSFLFKVALECGIGIFTKSTAEYKKRDKVFWLELDFVFANVVMALLADFMLVWLPAPTLSFAGTAGKAAARGPKWLSNIPENAFQMVQPGMQPFTLLQRSFSILRNGAKLLGVGIICSAIGVAATNGLIKAREMMDPNFQNRNPPQNVIGMGIGYGLYMGISSNLRYQILAGIVEERGIEKVLVGRPQLCRSLTFIARTANTYLGSLLWVDFLRIAGLQKQTALPAEEKGGQPPEKIESKAKSKSKKGD